MDAQYLLSACEQAGIDFFTGVPDSQLKGLCDTLFATYGINGKKHIVAANEGNALALCAGHYLATGRPGLCYMQNSGLGNAINPLTSLMDGQVYGLPCLLIIGWRGEPGIPDEPQHVMQGQITLSQLELLGVPYMVLNKTMTASDFDETFSDILAHLNAGRTVAIVVKKDGLSCALAPQYSNANTMTREEAIAVIARLSGKRDVFVATTGKLSRELFELRELMGEGHERDFLTVGSMGHASMIALGICLEQPERRIWCLDGDGAVLMHLGAMAVLGQKKPANLIHVVMNNAAHETVGGMPVCEGNLNLTELAQAAGYRHVFRAANEMELCQAVDAAMTSDELTFIEVMCAVGARNNLGRPTTTPQQNRNALMKFIQERV